MRQQILSGFLAASVIAGQAYQLNATASGDPSRYNVVWTTPSEDCHGSMPLGNGDIALNAWIEKDGDLQFYIGKTDAWDDNARLLKVGKVRVHLEPNPFTSGQAFRQELSLRDATIKIQSGAGRDKTTVQVWVDANQPVIRVAVESANTCEATAAFELWRTNQYEVEPQVSDVLLERGAPNNHHGPTLVEPDTILSGLSDRIGWVHHNKKSVGPQLLAEIQGIAGSKQEDPLLHRTFGAVISASRAQRMDDTHLRSAKSTTHRFDVFVLTRHPSSPERWLADANELIQRVESKSFSARRREHAKWGSEFWERSWIHASTRSSSAGGSTGDPPVPSGDSPDGRGACESPSLPSSQTGAPNDATYISQMYHLQRFITACAGRGAFPIKFNGSLFTVPPRDLPYDPDYRKWGPGYWWQNTRLPYESACASGDFDLMQPLFHMYTGEMLDLCKYRTRLYCGHEGAFYPECIMFWGATFSTVYGWTPFEERADKLQEHGSHKYAWVGGLELCAFMLDYFEHTLDKKFLRETTLPVCREILTFFEQHYPTNAQGELVMYPSQAVETWWDCTNAMPELAGLHAVTERLLTLPAADAPPQDHQLWQRLHAKLPPLPLREVDGKLALAPGETFANKRNSENPELYAVFPFRLIALERPNLDWGINALKLRTDKGSFGWRQDDVFMAYLGLTDDARRYVVARARKHDPNERFPAFWGPNYDWTPDQDHGGILMKAFQAMLMQTDGRKILLFPAWPKDWDVEFKLHAPYQTVVEGVYRDGKVKSLRVTPKSRRTDVVDLTVSRLGELN